MKELMYLEERIKKLLKLEEQKDLRMAIKEVACKDELKALIEHVVWLYNHRNSSKAFPVVLKLLATAIQLNDNNLISPFLSLDRLDHCRDDRCNEIMVLCLLHFIRRKQYWWGEDLKGTSVILQLLLKIARKIKKPKALDYNDKLALELVMIPDYSGRRTTAKPWELINECAGPKTAKAVFQLYERTLKDIQPPYSHMKVELEEYNEDPENYGLKHEKIDKNLFYLYHSLLKRFSPIPLSIAV
ncbi:MAG: hypothetical protein V1707_00260 [bacterium]